MNALYHKNEAQIQMVRYMAPSGKKYIFRMSSSYLRGDDGKVVITLSDETDATIYREKYIESSRTFSVFLHAFCVWIILYALWEFLNRPIPTRQMTMGVELLYEKYHSVYALWIVHYIFGVTGILLHLVGT